MNLCGWNYVGRMAMLIFVGLAASHRGAPVFAADPPTTSSQPGTETTSTNRSAMDLKASPFKGLESDLKKPFQIFDTGPMVGDLRPPPGVFKPPAMIGNNRRLKELREKREENKLFGPETPDVDRAEDDPFKAEEDERDLLGKKGKTPLDRFYDRLDRERLGTTNQLRNADSRRDNTDEALKDQPGRLFPEKIFSGELKNALSALSQPSNNPTAGSGFGGGFFSEAFRTRTFDDPATTVPKDLAGRGPSARETRLEEFRRLLEGPANPPSPGFASPGLPTVGAALRPGAVAPVAPAANWASPALAAPARDAFSGGAGLVGNLQPFQSLPSFAVTTPSLNPVPAPVVQPRLPPPAFNIPARKF